MGRRILQGRNAPTHRPDLHRAGETIPQENRSSRPGFEIFILLLVGASSISLVSAESGENSLIPLRLLFPPNPLRWASAGTLFLSSAESEAPPENLLENGLKSFSGGRDTAPPRRRPHSGSQRRTWGVLGLRRQLSLHPAAFHFGKLPLIALPHDFIR